MSGNVSKANNLMVTVASNHFLNCRRCIYHSGISGISFDSDGVCSYCIQAEELALKFGTGTTKGQSILDSIIETVRRDGKTSKYDCVVGVSGGTDSSYLLHLLTQDYGLRVLAVHYDNTWNTAKSTMNIARLVKKLGIDLYTHVVNNHEADDIFRSFFLAGVPELEASTDLGYAYLLRLTARKFRIRYIFEGHSFTAEGITPLTNNYFDGRYIYAIHRQFGNLPINTYPLMTLSRFLRSSVFASLKFIRPLWYLKYSKLEARKHLEVKYGWEYYGGHHLENRMTAFYHSVYLPRKFNADLRINSLAAEVRNAIRTKNSALQELSRPIEPELGLEDYFRRRLHLSSTEFDAIMADTPRSWKEFPTYKRTFEQLAPLFKLLADKGRVPMSFYLKYCLDSSSD